MPSIVSDGPYHHSTTTASPSNSFDIAQRKSYDKTPVGNTFLYTAGANGDAGRLESSNFYQQSDHNQFLTSLKNGSAHSLNGGARSSIGSYNRDRFFSKTDSTPSLASGSFRENRDQQPQSRVSAMSDGYVNGAAGHGPEMSSATSTTTAAAPHVNGAMPDSRISDSRSPTPSSRPTPNGDYYRLSTSEDRGSFLDSNQSAYHPNNFPLSTSLPSESSHLHPEPDRLAPPNKRSQQHRYSSPPAPADFEPTSPTSPSRHSQRSALQVPRSTTRRSRDYSFEETRAYATGRGDQIGPHFRRSSLSLVRRATRASTADLHPDESLNDEEAARWAEAIKQKRARKKRREEEDDERVIVGTKVDQNHVNWVTAYNMLTGIRFVVSRINAKMEREPTPADFDAKHKFSFDM